MRTSQYVCDLFCSMHHIKFINFYTVCTLVFGTVKHSSSTEKERRKEKKREEKGKKEERRKAPVNGWQGGGLVMQCHIFTMVLAITLIGCKNTANYT